MSITNKTIPKQRAKGLKGTKGIKGRRGLKGIKEIKEIKEKVSRTVSRKIVWLP